MFLDFQMKGTHKFSQDFKMYLSLCLSGLFLNLEHWFQCCTMLALEHDVHFFYKQIDTME